MAKEEKQLYPINEVLEGTMGYFPIGLTKTKEGKTVYVKKVLDEKGKMTDSTRVSVTLNLPGEKEKSLSKFLTASVSLGNAKLFKENGIDLGQKGEKPIRVRFLMREWQTQDEDGNYVHHTIREIINVGFSKDGAVDWVKKPQKAQQPKAEEKEPDLEDISDDDLPF